MIFYKFCDMTKTSFKTVLLSYFIVKKDWILKEKERGQLAVY